ncbi:hypothetical protein J6590_103048 [Homalodisca vitripennis]|nr:hypothetical protein J6590_103048 [Homalodisca vitripennis]
MPFQFSNEEYADIMFCYGYANGNAEAARREYQERFLARRIPNFLMLGYHLAKDGRHLNGSGNFKLGRIMLSTLLIPIPKSSHSDTVESYPSNDTLHPEAPVPVVSFCGPYPALSHAPSPMRSEASSGNGTLGVQMAAT